MSRRAGAAELTRMLRQNPPAAEVSSTGKSRFLGFLPRQLLDRVDKTPHHSGKAIKIQGLDGISLDVVMRIPERHGIRHHQGGIAIAPERGVAGAGDVLAM